MTTWDNIYKDYQSGGDAWATLSEGIIEPFIKFINEKEFSNKKAFDIGFGTGKYLAYLKNLGFEVSGIDSSGTAVDITKKILPESNLQQVNMYSFEILKNQYDLIISISTIHHGTKDQVQSLINEIYLSLIPNGKIFITLPDYGHALNKGLLKDHKEIAFGTFAPLSGPEKGLAHSFYSKDEIVEVFSKYKNVFLKLDEIGRWIITAEK